MSSPALSMWPSTVVPESSIASRSPPHSWFPEGDVSSSSLDKGDTNVAGLASKHKRAGKSSKDVSYLLKVFVLSYHHDFTLIGPQSWSQCERAGILEKVCIPSSRI